MTKYSKHLDILILQFSERKAMTVKMVFVKASFSFSLTPQVIKSLQTKDNLL